MTVFQYVTLIVMFTFDLVCNMILFRQSRQLRQEVDALHDRLDSQELPGS